MASMLGSTVGPPDLKKTSPTYYALDREFRAYVGYTKKRNSPGYMKPDDASFCRPAVILFELWNKYEPRLPQVEFHQKLLEMGDFLTSVKEYKLALWGCYDRYLLGFTSTSITDCNIDVEEFKKAYFLYDLKNDAVLTIQILLGKVTCTYEIIKIKDFRLVNKESVDQCLGILNFLTVLSQAIISREPFCWLVYNCTIQIYTLCRYLMTLGHSDKVSKFLLWACTCMETCVPLACVKFLPWRSTLYTAVCQCFYDCRNGEEAEAFARRGLVQIYELKKLEEMSSAGNEIAQCQLSFRNATLRMAIMVFRRAEIESRRKPKGAILRPKIMKVTTIKEMPWPHSGTEKLLANMFDCGSAQLLAILESLKDSNRRVFLTCPMSTSELEIQEVCTELFQAAQEILSGGGGSNPSRKKFLTDHKISALAGVIATDVPLFDLALSADDRVPIKAVVQLLKCAYNYEQWFFFNSLFDPVMNFLKLYRDNFIWEKKMLEILSVTDQLNRNSRTRKLPEEDKSKSPKKASKKQPPPSPAPDTVKFELTGKDIFHLAEVVKSVVLGPFTPESIDIDIMIDATFYLWNKCKGIFQRFQGGPIENIRYLQKMDSPNKWIYILDVVCLSFCWCDIGYTDPALISDVCFRMALVMESIAYFNQHNDNKTVGDESKLFTQTLEKESSPDAEIFTSVFSVDFLHLNPRELLLEARAVLEMALNTVKRARTASASFDGKFTADMIIKDFFPVSSSSMVSGTQEINSETVASHSQTSSKGYSVLYHNMIMDLHCELLLSRHRMCLQLAELQSNTYQIEVKHSQKIRKELSKDQYDASYVESWDELVAHCNKNILEKAMLYMQKASTTTNGDVVTPQQRYLLEEALLFIEKAQAKEKQIFFENIVQKELKIAKVPPPPLLICRSDTTMVFKPMPFQPESGQKVAWYKLFGRSASMVNAKVRQNDNDFSGTGELVSAYCSEITVTGLVPNDCYIFALAAYSPEGDLIGGEIGESSQTFIAAHPQSIFMMWGFLNQIAYQVGCYEISEKAFEVLWNYFVISRAQSGISMMLPVVGQEFSLSLYSMDKKLLNVVSPVLLRQFISSLFVHVDLSIQEGELFCDSICDKGPLFPGQVKRLKKCEKLLVAMELACWLNDANLALQAVVQCYGLLSPFLYHHIPLPAVIQIIQHCLSVLEEVSAAFRQKRVTSINDSMQHMTACMSHHAARVLMGWGQKQLAYKINEMGRKLLTEGKKRAVDDKVEQVDINKDKKGKGGRIKDSKKSKKGLNKNQDSEDNEELSALEANMLNFSEQVEKTGEAIKYNDTDVMRTYISLQPSALAYKEASRFKKKGPYLEFIVKTVEKALSEGNTDNAISWCEEAAHWFTKRNETNFGIKSNQIIKKEHKETVVKSSNPKKFSAAMVEYSKSKEVSSGSKKKKEPSGTSKKLKNIFSSEKPEVEAAKMKSMETFNKYLAAMVKSFYRRRHLRKTLSDERPWKTQLHLMQGVGIFTNILQKLEQLEKSSASKFYMQLTSMLEHEWFSFETMGAILSRERLSISELNFPMRKLTTQLSELDLAAAEPRISALEKAAEQIIAVSSNDLSPNKILDLQEEPLFSKTDPKYAHLTQLEKQSFSSEITREAVKKSFTFLNKALVSAHRGQHWTLLQNVSKVLWDCANTALLKVATPYRITTKEKSRISLETLHSLLWNVFFTAADGLLDMLWQLQNNLEKHTAKENTRNEHMHNKSVEPIHIFLGKSDELVVEDKVIESIDHLSNQTFSESKKRGKKKGNQFKSWMGSVNEEKGGACLNFERLLDDTSVVDSRFIRKITLRALEILLHENKYERLADIALRFTALTNDRYAEQTLPLLIEAQKKLKEKIESVGGPVPPQPHYVKLMAQLKDIVTAQNYLCVQLRVCVDKCAVKLIHPGACIDPGSHHIYDDTDGQRLVSVPLDVNATWNMMCNAVDSSTFTARALRHCRKLLCLYLAGYQEELSESFAQSQGLKVMFKNDPAKMLHSAPANFNRDEPSSEHVHVPMPGSQLKLVVNAYDKTIELLVAKNQNGLAAQAMHELGCLHFDADNIRTAYKLWTKSLDLILDCSNAVNDWRHHFSDEADLCQKLLKKCGIWGCLLGGVLAANIAQYILITNFGEKIECCFLSGYFFKALFRSSMPHPLSDRDYALYDIGEEFGISEVVPGVDFFSERFRCNSRQTIAALRWVTEELIRGRHYLFVLPLLTLHQYFTTVRCRDVQRTVDGQILRVRALTDLGMFSEALVILQYLFYGQRLPQMGSKSFREVDIQIVPMRLDATKRIDDCCNLTVFMDCATKCLPTDLSILYGPYLTCHLSLVHAHLLVAIADTLHTLPDKETWSPFAGSLSELPVLSFSSGITQDLRADKTSNFTLFSSEIPFIGSAKHVNLEKIKTMLLSAANRILNSLAHVFLEKYKSESGNLEAAELELLVHCKLELSAISCQKLHGPMAAELALSAMKLIKKSTIFSSKQFQKKSRNSEKVLQTSLEFSTSQQLSSLQLHNCLSQSRLDGHQWLLCGLALVRSLLIHIRGMGDIRGPEEKVLSELADCHQYCSMVLTEARACTDIELQAETLYQLALLNLIEGRDLQMVISLLQDTRNILQQVPQLSIPGVHLLAIATVFMTDLCVTSEQDIKQNTLSMYIQAQTLILDQLQSLGEKIDDHDPHKQFHCPVFPLKNTYLPEVFILAQVKLQCALVVAQITNQAIYTTNVAASDAWIKVHEMLITALQLNINSPCWEPSLEAEILLNIGKIERQLSEEGKLAPASVISMFLEAVKISYDTDHNLGLMKQAYLEVALLNLSTISKENVTIPSLENNSDTQKSESKSSVKSSRSTLKEKRTEEWSNKDMAYKVQCDLQKAAWLAVCCAASTARAQRNKCLLSGEASVSSMELPEKACKEIPDFIALDLLSPYVLGKKKRVFKSEEEKELAMFLDQQEPEEVESYDEKLAKIRDDVRNLSWSHILGYHLLIQQLFSKSGLVASTVENKHVESRQYPDIQLSSALSNHFVCSSVSAGKWSLRLVHLHSYLCQNLPVYSKCCTVYPPQDLELLSAFQKHPSTSFSETLTNISITELLGKQHLFSAYTKIADKTFFNLTTDEVAFVWYQPILGSCAVSSKHVLLVYATTNNTVTHTSAGQLALPLQQVEDLHSRLAMLTQEGEIMLSDNVKQKTNSKSLNKDLTEDVFQNDLLDCICKIENLLCSTDPDKSLTEVPFEINMKNLYDLEQLFDLSLGSTVVGTDMVSWIIELLL